MDYICHYPSPLGGITLASNGKELTGLWFDGQKYFADSLQKTAREEKLPVFEQTAAWLDLYFSGGLPDFIPPLGFAAGASRFRRRVWEILLTIPYGKTRTYGSIAEQLAEETGKKPAAQAVGGAVGHNAISLIIPCHRVVGRDGSLTGYAGGMEKKAALLRLEKANWDCLYIP